MSQFYKPYIHFVGFEDSKVIKFIQTEYNLCSSMSGFIDLTHMCISMLNGPVSAEVKKDLTVAVSLFFPLICGKSYRNIDLDI